MKPFAKALAIVGGAAAVLLVGVSLFNTVATPEAAAVKTPVAPAMQLASIGQSCKDYYADLMAPGRPRASPEVLKPMEPFKTLDGDVVFLYGKKAPESGEAGYADRWIEHIDSFKRVGCHAGNTVTWADDASTTAADSMGKILPGPARSKPEKVDYSWTKARGGDELRYLNKSKLWVEIRRKDPITDEESVQTCGTELTGGLEDQMNKRKGITTTRSHQNLCWGGVNKNIIFDGADERPQYAPSYGAAQVDVKFEMPDATNVVKHYTAFIATNFSALVLQCENGDCESTDFVTMARAANQFTIRFKAAAGGDIVQMYSSAALDPSLKPKTAPAPVEVKGPPPPIAAQSAPATSTAPPFEPTASEVRPSFDCAKARTVVEHLICNDASLASLDVRMSDSYKDALRTTDDRAGLRKAQKAWLEDSRNRCMTVACLQSSYEQRIASLSTPASK
ncbi:lysozyme inhibitor LprI family protein [Variovorax sp. dw_308]|uniref:lysozyme inhibitor LprI family protein n=1 Tax=Variovorax sp. dw_308 TaxID=2721546 RepID=UPI001C47C340|nr:lysozyme inhibitor LprI family protein [Variovorax sp. dw_308]